MAGNQHFERARQMFADQFEPDGNGYVYRKGANGKPIQLSDTERDKYIAAFNSYIKYASRGMVGGLILLTILFVTYATETGADLSDTALYFGISAILVLFMIGYYWAWNKPAREMRGRGSVGEARSRAEIRRLFFAKLTYGQIATVAVAGIFLIIRVALKQSALSGWDLAWLILAVIILILAVVQAFRKWRFDSVQR